MYVKPTRPIADYRTKFSGITKAHMNKAIPMAKAQKMIIDCIKVTFIDDCPII